MTKSILTTRNTSIYECCWKAYLFEVDLFIIQHSSFVWKLLFLEIDAEYHYYQNKDVFGNSSIRFL